MRMLDVQAEEPSLDSSLHVKGWPWPFTAVILSLRGMGQGPGGFLRLVDCQPSPRISIGSRFSGRLI